jgi:hypothetical protein
VFEEFLTVFNCSVLTFWSAIKFHRENRTYENVTNWCQKRDSRWKQKTQQFIIGHFDELRNRVPAKRSSVEDQLERSISAVCRAGGALEQVPERKGLRTD